MEPIFELKLEPIAKGARDAAMQLYRQLRAAIEDGRLAPGARLPPTRRASAYFGVSRNTAIGVYERLSEERLVTMRHGAGTFVETAAPDRMRPTAQSEPRETDARIMPFWSSPELTAAIGYWRRPEEPEPIGDKIIDLRPAVIDSRLFPFGRLRQSLTLQLRRMEKRPAGFRGPWGNQGNFHLRSAIARHTAVTRAVACVPDDIIVTSGAQQAFDLIARVLVRPGQTRVAIEDPGYPPMRAPFASAGAIIVPIPVDDDGLRVDLIPEDVRIICTCPSHQFPLGVPLSSTRRAHLLAFAKKTGAIVVEDDYDSEFRYEDGPLTTLRSAATDDQVFYVGTFSKSMLPSLRLGYLIPPHWARSALVTAKNLLDWHVSSPLQLGVANFIAQGHLTKHVSHMRKVYGERRRALLAAASKELPCDIRALPSHYGMHVTLISSDDRDLETVAVQAGASGIALHSLSRYFLGPQRTQGLVIGLGTADSTELAKAVHVIGELIGKSRS